MTHPFVPVPESLMAVWSDDSIPHRQHTAISSSCTYGNSRIIPKAGPDPTASGYLYRGPTDSFRRCVETGQLHVKQQGTLLDSALCYDNTSPQPLYSLLCHHPDGERNAMKNLQHRVIAVRSKEDIQKQDRAMFIHQFV